MGKATHNGRLRELIGNVSSATDRATSTAELLEAIQWVRDFKEPLEFDNSTPKTIGIISTLITLAIIAFSWWGPTGAKQWLSLTQGIGFFSFVTMVASFGFMGHRSRLLHKASENMARRSSLIANGLTQVTTPADYLLLQLSSQFGDYARGNYSRDITCALESVYRGDVHALGFRYFQLHYVNQRVVTTTESDGKGGTRTVTKIVYDHYDRYSLVVDFPWVESITARTGSGSGLDFEYRYKTASTDFNKAFTLSGSSTMACAKFAKPVTVLHLLTMHKRLREMNLEFSFDGQLCVSFDDKNMLDFHMPCDLSRPDDFYAYIEAGAELPHLRAVLDLVHKLAEQHDDNFNLPTPSAHYEEN